MSNYPNTPADAREGDRMTMVRSHTFKRVPVKVVRVGPTSVWVVTETGELAGAYRYRFTKRGLEWGRANCSNIHMLVARDADQRI